MKVVELLRRAGAMAGLIRVDDEIQSVEVTVWEKRIVSLQQLQQDAEREQQQGLAAPPPEITVGFDQVFAAVGIQQPQHGWTVDKLKEALGDTLSKDHQKAAGEASTILQSNKIPPEDIIRDAVSRDKALDSYETFLGKKIEERANSRKTLIEDLKQRIQESEQQILNLKASQENDVKSFEEWQNKKVQKEEELARVVSLLTQEPSITLGKNRKKS